MADVFTFPEERFLLVGKITRAHGLKGEIKVFVFSEDPAQLLRYKKIVLVDSEGRLSKELTIERSRVQEKAAIVKIAGIDDRSGAEDLQGAGMLIEKETLPETGDDEYYWYRLYDLPVATEDGRHLGKVDAVFSNGAQDIMIVRDGETEYLIPLIESVVRKQTEEGVVIAPPPGLLEIYGGEHD